MYFPEQVLGIGVELVVCQTFTVMIGYRFTVNRLFIREPFIFAIFVSTIV